MYVSVYVCMYFRVYHNFSYLSNKTPWIQFTVAINNTG